SCLAAWMNPQVLTSTTSVSPPSASVQPPASSRAASSSESTSFRAQPSVTRLTVRPVTRGAFWLDDTPADYGKPAGAKSPAGGCDRSRISAGRLLVRAETERHWLARRVRGDRVLPVHRQRDATGVAEHHLHRAVLGPLLRRAGVDDAAEDRLAGRRGQLNPAVRRGGQMDDNVAGMLMRGGCRRCERLRRRLPHRGPCLWRRGGGGGPRRAFHQVVDPQADNRQQDHGQRQAPVEPAPLPELDRRGRLENVCRRNRLRRALGRVVLPDQRLRVDAGRACNAAKMAPCVEVAAARRIVATLDAPDNCLPDAGPLTDLRGGETGLTACLRQGVTNAHAAPPLLSRATCRPGCRHGCRCPLLPIPARGPIT